MQHRDNHTQGDAAELAKLRARCAELEQALGDAQADAEVDEYRLLLDTINTHVFYLADPATYGMVNRAHAEFFGLTKSDLAYKSLYDILDTAEADVCVEGNRRIFADKEPIVTEELMERFDGEKRLFAYTKTPKFNSSGDVEYVVCTGEDITEATEAKAALAASQYFLENVIESIQDGISVLDTEFRIVHANGVMREWHRSSGELIGRKCHQAYHHQDSLCPVCPTQKVFQTGAAASNVVQGLPGSAAEWLELFCFPLKDPDTGEVTGVVEFVRDITERVKLEKQLVQAQKMKAVGTLSSGIAHDFNNILQTILGSIQLLIRQSDRNPTDLKYLGQIETAVNRAKELTSRLLYFSRDIDSNLKPVILSSEMGNLVHLLERSLPKMVRINTVFGDHLGHIYADVVQIEQVILNLAINAGHAMPGGGELTLRMENVSIPAADADANGELLPGEYVAVTIRDTGVGMSSDTLGHIFEPFFTTKPADQGTGLGLSMVYGIVKNHNGIITCDSEEGAGTTFKLYFPAVDAPEPDVSDDPGVDLIEVGNETVLVVDDEALLLDIASEHLSAIGYRTVTALSGEAAMALLAARKPRIDLVLLDLNMPGMGGYQCLLQIREMDPAPKVIVASGYAANDQIQRMIASGAAGFLQKPYRIHDLGQAVRTALDDR